MDTAYKTTLELDKVLARAVQLCACQETKEMMQALEPAPTVEDERYDLAQTNAINALLIKNGSPRFGSVHEVRRIVAHARKGGILSMGELLEIAATLRNFSGLSQWYGLSEHEMLPTDDLFFALAPQPVLEKQIAESILSPEEMADTASVTLHDLRRKIRQTEDSIRTKLDNIIRNSTTNKFLQDAVVSLRNTPEALGKRILDFSFGVACAFEAQVECVSGHVFVITRGAGLSDAEASRLKAQGLM